MLDSVSPCTCCGTASRCLAASASPRQWDALAGLIGQTRLLSAGEYLYRTGDRCRTLYMVRSGTFKTTLPGDARSDLVVGHHLPGDLLGLDVLSTDHYSASAIALETAGVCAFAKDQLENLAAELPDFHRRLREAMSEEIARAHQHCLVLSRRSAEQRLAGFLMDLSDRLERRGFRTACLELAFTRVDIAAYLGLAVETVCREFTRFQTLGWIAVRRRRVELLDTSALRALAGAESPVDGASEAAAQR
ncbi:MAG TPA: helix-turn-helix domain-containing protein [Gammaproteobacteria bacterium]|nr:helix-turn-helix domain-containing protein [Gammaproteobacteria bacterium]